MELRGVNDRIKKLKEQSEEATPYILMERAMLMMDTYEKYEGEVSAPELRVLSMKEIFSRKTITTGNGKLIVGGKGAEPQSTFTSPKLCCHTLEDMKVMNNRRLICFKVGDEDTEQQEETIIPSQERRPIYHETISSMSQEWKNYYEAGASTEFVEQRGPGYTAGSERIYVKGFLDHQEDIERVIAAADFLSDPEVIEKRNEPRGMSTTYDATMILGKHYATLAREFAEEEGDSVRKEELLQTAANCDVVPAHKLKAYWQAIQTYWFVHLGVTTELNPWDVYSLERLDQHLNPSYEADIEAGRLDRSKVKELLEYPQVKFSNQPAPPKVGIMLKELSAYVDSANISTGGITPDEEDGINDVSYLILDVMDEMKLLQPSNNVQISKRISVRFIERTCETSRGGWEQPAFYNTETIIQELLNTGEPIKDACRGGASSCVEIRAFGWEAYIPQGYFNLLRTLEITPRNGWSPVDEKRLDLQLGEAEDFKSYDELFDAHRGQIEYLADTKAEGSNIVTCAYAKYMPVPFLSIIIDDCTTSGKDHNTGDARYSMNYLQGIGIGIITDSLSAVKYDVCDKKNFTMGELMKALQDNFGGGEHVRLCNLVSHETPKYENDNDYTDAIVKEVLTFYKNTVIGHPNVRNGQWKINILPITYHVYFGEVMLASPNGRLACRPASERISPEKAADVNGPTSIIRSASKMDCLSTGGTPLNQKFTPSVVAGKDGLSSMAGLIHSYFNMDGHHIQFNVIGHEILIKAQQNPAEHHDLIVRAAGYFDHFRNLSKELQDEITNRTEQSLS